MQGSLAEDFAALRKLATTASGALKEYFGAGEDPREWKYENWQGKQLSRVTWREDGRVTELILCKCASLAVLPDVIGGLGALTKLHLSWSSSLAKLPAAIGELKALTTLNLRGCSSLDALPDAIGELEALTTLDLSYCRFLTALPAAIGGLGALTKLHLSWCSSLTTLPDAIGELGALTQLDLTGCASLAALPDSIGKLGSLTELFLSKCSSLTYPPEEMRGRYDVHKTVGFCCLSLLEGGDVSAADVKKSILNHVLSGVSTERIDALMSKDPAFADIIKGPSAILDVDFAALRKLRADDASGALKEFFGDGEDPREWKYGPIFDPQSSVTVADGRVTKLDLLGCSDLAALPDAIGELKALTQLDLSGCESLDELPDAIGGLGALTTLWTPRTRWPCVISWESCWSRTRRSGRSTSPPRTVCRRRWQWSGSIRS